MAVFYNRATLSYNGTEISSNLTQGEIVSALAVTKTAVTETYEQDGTVTYAVSMSNTGDTPLNGLTLEDDLGGYTIDTETVTPLEVIEGSVKVFIDGTLSDQAQTEAGPPMTVTGIDLPAGSSAVIVYETQVNGYAPLGTGITITNTATVTGAGLTSPATASATVTAEDAPILSIVKSLSPETVSENGTLTYTFTIYNNGGTEASAGLVMTDTFDPVLTDISVEINGTAAPDTAYTYDQTTGKFATTDGALTVPAAAYSQDITTKAWSTEPGMAVVTITGTI